MNCLQPLHTYNFLNLHRNLLNFVSSTNRFRQILMFYLVLASLIVTASTRPHDCLRWNCPCAGATKREQRFPKRGFVSMTGEARSRTQGLLRKMVADRFYQNDNHVRNLQHCVDQRDSSCVHAHTHAQCSLHDLALVDQLNVQIVHTEDDLMLLLKTAHRLLSTVAIYIEQARKDENRRLGDPKNSLEHEIKLIEELGIYNLLCKLQSTMFSHGATLPESISRDVMHTECRSLREMAKTDNRNFMVFLSLDKVLDALLGQLEKLDESKL